MSTGQIDSLPEFSNFGRHFERVEKNFNFSTRDPDHLHACGSRVYGAIFSKNRFFGTTHGDKPVSQNGISLRSPSLIMAPGYTNDKNHKISSMKILISKL